MNQVMSEKPTRTAIETQIVENLKRVYNEKLEEQVPDRFLDLIKQLRDQEAGGGKSG